MTDYEAMWSELRNWVIINIQGPKGLKANAEINRIMEKYKAPFSLGINDFVSPNEDGTVHKTKFGFESCGAQR